MSLRAYTAASLTLGARTGMPFFTAFAAALIVALAGAWTVVAARSAHGLWHGHLVQAPCLNCKTQSAACPARSV